MSAWIINKNCHDKLQTHHRSSRYFFANSIVKYVYMKWWMRKCVFRSVRRRSDTPLLFFCKNLFDLCVGLMCKYTTHTLTDVYENNDPRWADAVGAFIYLRNIRYHVYRVPCIYVITWCQSIYVRSKLIISWKLKTNCMWAKI